MATLAWFLPRIKETFLLKQKGLNERGAVEDSGLVKPAALLKCYMEDIKHGHLMCQLLQG